jgi:hypothetical protein
VAGLGGLIERIGDAANSVLTAKQRAPGGGAQKWEERVPIPNHTAALERLMRFLSDNVSPKIEQEARAL